MTTLVMGEGKVAAFASSLSRDGRCAFGGDAKPTEEKKSSENPNHPDVKVSPFFHHSSKTAAAIIGRYMSAPIKPTPTRENTNLDQEMLSQTITPIGRPADSAGVSCERRVIFPTYHSKVHCSNQKEALPEGGSLPLMSPSNASVRQRPTPTALGVSHEYRNHLLSNFVPETNRIPSSKATRIGNNDRRTSIDDICIGLGTPSHPSKKINKKRSSVLPSLPPLTGKSAGATKTTLDESTVESNGTASTDSTTSTRDTVTSNKNCGPVVVSPARNTSKQPDGKISLEEEQQVQQQLNPRSTASPHGYRRIVSASPHQPCSPAIISKAQIDTLVARLPRVGLVSPSRSEPSSATTPGTPPTSKSTLDKKPLKSILRENPRYASRGTDASMQQSSVEASSSVPSLVDIKKTEGDTDDEGEDDVVSNGPPGCPDDQVESKRPSTPQALESEESNDLQEEESFVREASLSADGSEVGTPVSREYEGNTSRHVVSFDPRVWVREFHRDPEEETHTWYNNEDMERFKRLALDRILRYQGRPSEIITTGTARVVQRALPRWSGPVYAHPSLTLDGENDNDSYIRKRVLEKELRSILIVDPHDLSLKLFTKSLKRALPSTAHVTTAVSSDEVLKLFQQGQRFDLIIVEERLQLFHRHHSSSSTSSSTESDITSDRQARCGSSASKSSGAALIETLSKSSVASNSLFVGVSAHMLEDEEKLRRCGADFCWPKPPPPIDQALIEKLAKRILEKRGRDILAAELFS